MIIIIPIGGIGQRFKENGYKKPKALINIYGKPIISYLLDNLNTDNIDYIFIPYNKEYNRFRFEDFLIKYYPKLNFKFYCLENNTRGAAETIDIGIKNLNEDRDIPVICLDSDNWYNCDIKKILHHINSHTNIDNDKTSITPGTTILHKNIWYDTYEDWFFDNYNIISNSDSVSHLYNKLFSIIDNAGYTISNIKRFKNELIYFIYKNST